MRDAGFDRHSRDALSQRAATWQTNTQRRLRMAESRLYRSTARCKDRRRRSRRTDRVARVGRDHAVLPPASSARGPGHSQSVGETGSALEDARKQLGQTSLASGRLVQRFPLALRTEGVRRGPVHSRLVLPSLSSPRSAQPRSRLCMDHRLTTSIRINDDVRLPPFRLPLRHEASRTFQALTCSDL